MNLCNSALVCVMAGSLMSAATARAEDEVDIGHNAAGKLVVEKDLVEPLTLEASVFPGINGYATGLVGFHSTEVNAPELDFFAPSELANIQAIFVSADAGFQVFNGFHIMTPGDTLDFGSPIFDFHPIFNIFAGNPGEEFTVRFTLHDLSGTYSDSDEFSMTFTPVPGPGAAAVLGMGGLVASRRRRV